MVASPDLLLKAAMLLLPLLLLLLLPAKAVVPLLSMIFILELLPIARITSEILYEDTNFFVSTIGDIRGRKIEPSANLIIATL